LSVAALLLGCSLDLEARDTATVRVEAPGLPAVWPEAEAWELTWLIAPGRGSPGPERGGPLRLKPGQAVAIELPRSREAVFLAEAVLGAFRSLPYGAAWPQGLEEGGRLRLSAEGGYAASAAAALYRAGRRSCPLDLARLGASAAGRLTDPWDIDPVSLAAAIGGGGFRVDHLRSPRLERVALDGLAESISGSLAPDSPWGRPLAVLGGVATAELAPGRVRRWLGGGYELSLVVSLEGEAAWTLSAQAGTRMEKTLPEPSRLWTETSPP